MSLRGALSEYTTKLFGIHKLLKLFISLNRFITVGC